MSDGNKIYGLEPIDEEDLNLEKKFKKGEAQKETLRPKEKVLPPMEQKAEKTPEKNLVERESTYQKILKKAYRSGKSNPSDDRVVKSDAQSIYAESDADAQVQRLVDLAFSKGVVHAVKVARHLEDFYVLDRLHDRLLADELHEALIQKGLI